MSREGRKRWGFWQTFVIGKQNNPMMKRLRLIQTPWGGVYVHFIYREDLDPVPHDHPWNFWRMVLRGGYVEWYFADPERGKPELRYQGPLRPSRIPVTHAHRITSVKPGTISLVVVGKKQRVWGFWSPEALPLRRLARGPAHPDGPGPSVMPGRMWVDYRDALGLRPTEGVRGEGIRAILEEAIPPADPSVHRTGDAREAALGAIQAIRKQQAVDAFNGNGEQSSTDVGPSAP